MQSLTGDRHPESRLRLLAFLSGAPGLVAAAFLLWNSGYSPAIRLLILSGIVLGWLLMVSVLVQQLRYSLRTLSNLISSLREGDYSFRARGGRRDNAMGELILELNALADQLRSNRLDAREAAGLLRSVMEEIDVAVFAFNPEQRLCLANRAGQRLLRADASLLLGRTAEDLGLGDCLLAEPSRTLDRSPGGSMGRWALRRSTFRQDGLPHQLVVLTDLSRALREEERLAWQRIVRVLGHEINNSLAPIMSIATSLDRLASGPARPEDWTGDLKDGLAVIRSRAEALNRFMQAYTHLARLPIPVKRTVNVQAWVKRAVALETRLAVQVQQGPDLQFLADPDQLDQLLINLVRNAVDAASGRARETPAGDDHPAIVTIAWKAGSDNLEVSVSDNGPGLSSTSNLFVPFFTTKPGGSGIGLAICRQIAEAHGGNVTLRNRSEGFGCIALVTLPRTESGVTAS